MKKTILVIYFARDIYPLRDTIKSHLFSYKKFSKNKIVYINLAFGFPEKIIKKLHLDGIIFHTSFLSLRWNCGGFNKKIKEVEYLKEVTCSKIAIPQDEFYNTDILNQFIIDFGITHIFTCSFEDDWRKIYDKIDTNKVQLRTILTGYIDNDSVKRINKLKEKHKKRNIDIGYRAWKAEYWLGEHGLYKTQIADIFKKSAIEKGYKVDISLEEKDVLLGDNWFEFLLKCRATLGVEGGASILDKNGNIKEKVDEYLNINNNASFEETKIQCFANEDDYINLKCISPRHFEACITETCQFLIEGNYNNILQPWVHYVPIKKDFSNISQVLDTLVDLDKITSIAKKAYEEIVLSDKWNYRTFVEIIDQTISDNNKVFNKNHNLHLLYNLLFRDIINWQQLKIRTFLSKILKIRK